jgi:putative RNA 2'-phosphotransferase
MAIERARIRDLSRLMSLVLRHQPETLGLRLDADGWTSTAGLVAAIRSCGEKWRGLEEADLQTVVDSSDKKRHEISDGRIRAVYGHSLDVEATRAASVPPPVLFHGTSPTAVAAILRQGLRPMARQFVHLSTDRETAVQVGRRSSPSPTILSVRAYDAHLQGIPFHKVEARIWQARAIPAAYVTTDDS